MRSHSALSDQSSTARDRLEDRSLRARVSGVIKFFNPHSSFGYIVQDDGSEDLYVHAKALSAVPGGVLQAGDKVEYRVAVFNERPRAKDVRVLKRA